MRHQVGIHQVYRLRKRGEWLYIARCDACGWDSYETSPENAQWLAIEHNGGTLAGEPPAPAKVVTEEMFPGVA